MSMRFDLTPTGMAGTRATRWMAIGWLLLMVCLVLQGCSTAPTRKEPLQLKLLIETSGNLNSDEQGRAAPVMVRVYELKSAAAFDSADFFTLQNEDKNVLAADLLAVDEFIMRPGTDERIERKSNPATTAIGVQVGYRELGKSVWRATWRLPEAPDAAWYRAVVPDRTVALKIEARDQAVSITEVN
jgi:type VI secretion system protein VasD